MFSPLLVSWKTTFTSEVSYVFRIKLSPYSKSRCLRVLSLKRFHCILGNNFFLRTQKQHATCRVWRAQIWMHFFQEITVFFFYLMIYIVKKKRLDRAVLWWFVLLFSFEHVSLVVDMYPRRSKALLSDRQHCVVFLFWYKVQGTSKREVKQGGGRVFVIWFKNGGDDRYAVFETTSLGQHYYYNILQHTHSNKKLKKKLPKSRTVQPLPLRSPVLGASTRISDRQHSVVYFILQYTWLQR